MCWETSCVFLTKVWPDFTIFTVHGAKRRHFDWEAVVRRFWCREPVKISWGVQREDDVMQKKKQSWNCDFKAQNGVVRVKLIKMWRGAGICSKSIQQEGVQSWWSASNEFEGKKRNFLKFKLKSRTKTPTRYCKSQSPPTCFGIGSRDTERTYRQRR